jgi:hypothetical protein
MRILWLLVLGQVETSMRIGSPTWIAASPMPGASYMVSSMSSAKPRKLVVDALHRLGNLTQHGIGKNDEGSDRHGRQVIGRDAIVNVNMGNVHPLVLCQRSESSRVRQ